MKIKPKFKKRWVAALRSGEYEQSADGVLRTTDGRYDVLGVLCDISKEGKWIKNSGWYLYEYEKDASVIRITSKLRDKFIKSEDGPFTFHDVMNLNDFYGANFEEIADAIEEHM